MPNINLDIVARRRLQTFIHERFALFLLREDFLPPGCRITSDVNPFDGTGSFSIGRLDGLPLDDNDKAKIQKAFSDFAQSKQHQLIPEKV
jgi:hypothetical protein